jgi:hypothetical protein
VERQTGVHPRFEVPALRGLHLLERELARATRDPVVGSAAVRREPRGPPNREEVGDVPLVEVTDRQAPVRRRREEPLLLQLPYEFLA